MVHLVQNSWITRSNTVLLGYADTVGEWYFLVGSVYKAHQRSDRVSELGYIFRIVVEAMGLHL